MKKLVNVQEVADEGLIGLLGELVVVWCARYFYFGKLVGVNKDDILLENPAVVYETGPLTDKKFKDAQKLPGPWYVRTAAIESYAKIEITL